MIRCWTCMRLLMAKRTPRPKPDKDGQVPSGVKVEVVVTCHACQVSYKLTTEKL